MTLLEEITALKQKDRLLLASFVRRCRTTNQSGNYLDGFEVLRGRGRRPMVHESLLIRRNVVVQTGWTLRGGEWYRLISEEKLNELRRSLQEFEAS